MRPGLKEIRLLLLDVDGVMTDGGILFDDNGVESKQFHVRDGHGIKLLQRAGVQVGIITGRSSRVVEVRAAELGIELVFQGQKRKLDAYRKIKETLGLSDDRIAYVGDDLVDLPVLREVGWSATVPEAPEEVRAEVDHVTVAAGGKGAVREVCELILKAGDGWKQVTRRYYPEGPA